MRTREDKEQTALTLIRAQLEAASNPIVLCSFGKDSLVLLHLCLQVRKVPVIFFRFSKFPEKNAHAYQVIQDWDLEVFDMWPTTVDEYQHGEYFEVLHGYQTGPNHFIYLTTGVRRREGCEQRYLCAVCDLIGRPRSFGHTYPWDVTMHGQKGSDQIGIGQDVPITHPVSQLGATRLVVPLSEWDDQDVWAYIRQYDLPYDRSRYDERNEASSPDTFPTCYRCLDSTLLGQKVYCPKEQRDIVNVAKTPIEHALFREQVIGSLQYCQVQGEPRTTAHADHL